MSLVNPLFLIGALVAAVPILLHLIKREQAQKIAFPTLMYLRRISRRTIRYQKLRHLLLLLLRILAVLFVVFAFMRPYREKAAAAIPAGRQASTHIIVLDNSMSMGYQDRWQRAKKAAADIVRGALPGDRFAVLEFSDKTTARTQLTSSPSETLAQLENDVELSDRSTRYGQALKAAETFALDAGTSKRILHLISDFQKNAWAVEEQSLRLAAGIELRYVDVGSKEFSNLTIRDVHVTEEDRNAAVIVRIRASVMNFGNRDRKGVPVKLYVDGRVIADKRIDAAKGNSQTIEFLLPALNEGLHPVVIEVDDAYLERDNRFYLTIETRGKTSVQVVESSGTKSRRPPSYFLARALNVDVVSPYNLMAVSPLNLSISGKLLIWNDVPSGNARIQNMLQDFVKAGGGLVVVLGNATQAADFNRGFGSWLSVKVIETAPAGSRMGKRPAEDYVLMTDVRMDHPIFQPFREPHSGTFSNARFFSHARLSLGPDGEIPARFENGDPALVSLVAGKGRVLIFASSADDTANDLPLKAVYAPFWQQMLHYLENFRERRQWQEIGDIIDYRKLLTEASSQTRNPNPDLITEAVAIRNPKKQRLIVPAGSDDLIVDMAGFYEIRAMNRSVSVGVNPVLKESDLTQGNAEEMIAGWISPDAPAFSGSEPLSIEEQDRNQPYWVYLLIAAFLLLVSESLFSNYELRITNDELKQTSKDIAMLSIRNS
jgi:hypothetical protein